MTRVKKGMSINEIRQIWRPRAQAKAEAIMNSYHAQHERSGGGFGHEGLGVYGIYQVRVAREKVRLAAKLLGQAGLEVSCGAIRKVTGQSLSTIASYWSPPRPTVEDDEAGAPESDCPRIIRFPGKDLST